MSSIPSTPLLPAPRTPLALPAPAPEPEPDPHALMDQVMPFAHTRQAWEVINQEADTVLKRADQLFKSPTTTAAEVAAFGKRAKNLENAMSYNDPTLHLLQPGDTSSWFWAANMRFGTWAVGMNLGELQADLSEKVKRGGQSTPEEGAGYNKAMADMREICRGHQGVEVSETVYDVSADSVGRALQDGTFANTLMNGKFFYPENRQVLYDASVQAVRAKEAELEGKVDQLGHACKKQAWTLGLLGAGVAAGCIFGSYLIPVAGICGIAMMSTGKELYDNRQEAATTQRSLASYQNVEQGLKGIQVPGIKVPS